MPSLDCSEGMRVSWLGLYVVCGVKASRLTSYLGNGYYIAAVDDIVGVNNFM